MTSVVTEREDLAFETFLPFCRPAIDEAAIAEVVDSLRSGWITTGPKVARFEDMLRQYLEAPYALTLSSATAGLYLALQALELQPGDEVITTPLTFAATLNVIVSNQLKPVLVDVEPDTYNMNIAQIAAKITPRTRVIMPVHFAGLAVDLEALYKLADHYGLRVIEDAAHAIGTTYKGRRIGSFGDTQVFSFHPNKNMTTGEGGCITTRDKVLAEKIMLLRFHGMDRESWDRFGKTGSQHYEIVTPGHKFNMMDIQAALGIHQLPQLDGFIARRKHLVERYIHKLSDLTALQLPASGQSIDGHAWYIFAPCLKKGERDEFMTTLKSFNVGTGLHYRATHLYPYYQQTFGWQRGDFPHAESIGDRIVSLPLFPGLTDAQQDKVIDIIRYVLTDMRETAEKC